MLRRVPDVYLRHRSAKDVVFLTARTVRDHGRAAEKERLADRDTGLLAQELKGVMLRIELMVQELNSMEPGLGVLVFVDIPYGPHYIFKTRFPMISALVLRFVYHPVYRRIPRFCAF